MHVKTRNLGLASCCFLTCCLSAAAYWARLHSFLTLTINHCIYVCRTACLALGGVGVDPAEPTVPTETHLWREGPEPFHYGGAGRTCCYGERKTYACSQSHKSSCLGDAAALELPTLDVFINAIPVLFCQRSCREGCGLSNDVTVPQTKVNFDDWEKKSVSRFRFAICKFLRDLFSLFCHNFWGYFFITLVNLQWESWLISLVLFGPYLSFATWSAWRSHPDNTLPRGPTSVQGYLGHICSFKSGHLKAQTCLLILSPLCPTMRLFNSCPLFIFSTRHWSKSRRCSPACGFYNRPSAS